MRILSKAAVFAVTVFHITTWGQTAPGDPDTQASLVGKWVYRSFRPFLPLGTPFNDIRFGEGEIDFRRIDGDRIIDASLDMGGGYVLTLTGSVVRDGSGHLVSLSWQGRGVAGTPTDGWIYDYKASIAPTFPTQTNRSAILIGQTLRTVAHGSSAAGVTGPFFMARFGEKQAPSPTSAIAPRMSISQFTEFDKYKFEIRTKPNPGPGEPTREMVVVRDDRSPEAKHRLEALMRGVRVMKGRKPSDPKSWFFQAAVHGVSDEAIRDAADRDPGVAAFISTGGARKFWNQCPHDGQSSADFLVWHRAYLYYFERILREASDDPTLSLPYWDYTGSEKHFPVCFAIEHIPTIGESTPMLSVPTNPLFDGDREFAIGQRGATQLNDRVTDSWNGIPDLQPGLKDETQFFGPSEDQGFAGGVYDNDANTKGMIERQPHDNVHIAVGGIIRNETGRMAEVQQAAHDPIFWVHHANIDRLWVRWDNLPGRRWGSFPNATWFVSSPWFFYDTDGHIKSERRVHYFDNTKLGIQYDDMPDTPNRLSSTLPFDVEKFDAEVEKLSAAFAPPSSAGVFALTRPTMLDLKGGAIGLAKEFKPRLELPQPTLQKFLEVEHTQPAEVPNVGFDVVLAVSAEGTTTSVRVGSLSLFGLGHDHNGDAGQMQSDTDHHKNTQNVTRSVRQRFNVTSLLAKPGFDASKVTVKLQPYDLTKVGDAAPQRRLGGIALMKHKFIEN